MTRRLTSFFGSKYIDTIGLKSEDLVPLIKEDIREAIGYGELPKGDYDFSVRHSIVGDSIELDCWLDDYHDGDKLREYKETVSGIMNEYNYFRSEAADGKDRRFYSDEVDMWKF